LITWGVADALDDPGEVLLRLVTQSRKRADLYAHLLQEAFEAAERLKQAHAAGMNIEPEGDAYADTAETARGDLDRIFNTGGVAARDQGKPRRLEVAYGLSTCRLVDRRASTG
jgi:hypothetical protein